MKTGINFQSFEIKKIDGEKTDRVEVISQVHKILPGVVLEVKRECYVYEQKVDCTFVKLITNDATDYLERTVGICVDI